MEFRVVLIETKPEVPIHGILEVAVYAVDRIYGLPPKKTGGLRNNISSAEQGAYGLHGRVKPKYCPVLIADRAVTVKHIQSWILLKCR